jgi:hypothetical protein
MRPALALLLGLAFFADWALAKDINADYSQSYVIFIKGAVAGNETVTEKNDEAGNLVSSSDHELFVTDGLEVKRMAFTTKMVLSKDKKTTLSLSFQYTTGGGAGDSYDIHVTNGQVTRTLNKGGQSTEASIPLESKMVIFDNTVYHHFDYLVPHYDFKKGGRQLFQYFVPVIGNDIPLALTFLGDENLELKNGKQAIRNFKIEFANIWGGSFAVDKDGRLIRLVIPTQSLEVVRKDILDSIKSQN